MKPCSNCECIEIGIDVEEIPNDQVKEQKLYRAVCHQCGTKSEWFLTEDRAKETWDSRPIEDKLKQENEEFKKAINEYCATVICNECVFIDGIGHCRFHFTKGIG